MDTIVIPKTEYRKLRHQADAYKKIAGNLNELLLRDSVGELADDIRKTGLYAEEFIDDLEKGLRRSSYGNLPSPTTTKSSNSMPSTKLIKRMNYFKIISVNLFTLASAFIGTTIALFLDEWFGLPSYASPYATIAGLTLILYGLFFRLWASSTFYRNDLKVLGLKTQQNFTTEGPYQYSRNPLYVGIIAISFGFVIYAGSIIGLVGVTLIPLLGWSLWVVYGEEKGLEQKFGDPYRAYKRAVPRWVGTKALFLFIMILLFVTIAIFGLALYRFNPHAIFISF